MRKYRCRMCGHVKQSTFKPLELCKCGAFAWRRSQAIERAKRVKKHK